MSEIEIREIWIFKSLARAQSENIAETEPTSLTSGSISRMYSEVKKNINKKYKKNRKWCENIAETERISLTSGSTSRMCSGLMIRWSIFFTSFWFIHVLTSKAFAKIITHNVVCIGAHSLIRIPEQFLLKSGAGHKFSIG